MNDFNAEFNLRCTSEFTSYAVMPRQNGNVPVPVHLARNVAVTAQWALVDRPAPCSLRYVHGNKPLWPDMSPPILRLTLHGRQPS